MKRGLGSVNRSLKMSHFFFVDLFGHLLSEEHRSRESSALVLRRAYVLTKGFSEKVIVSFFRLFRRNVLSPPTNTALLDHLVKFGYAVKTSFLDDASVAHLREAIGALTPERSSRVRIDYDQRDLVEIPEIRSVICDPEILRVAGAFLGCQPIFTQVAAWQSLHDDEATEDELSVAAQMFHFDMDWPKFVKFFIYLTDVTEEDGPFSIIEGTHRTKPTWEDRRFTASELLERHDLKPLERRLTGRSGSLIIADTSAFHRGTPVIKGPRLVLQIEFAVSRLGGSFQYPLLPQEFKPHGGEKRTFDVFCI